MKYLLLKVRMGGMNTMIKEWMQGVPDWTPEEVEATFHLIDQMWGMSAASKFRNHMLGEKIAHAWSKKGGKVMMFVDYADGGSDILSMSHNYPSEDNTDET